MIPINHDRIIILSCINLNETSAYVTDMDDEERQNHISRILKNH